MTVTMTLNPGDASTGAQWPTITPATQASALTQINMQDAANLAAAVINSISDMRALEQQVMTFADTLADPNAQFGNTIDSSLGAVGQFTTVLPPIVERPNVAVASVAPPPDLLVSAITLPTIDPMPIYTQNNLGFVWDESMWNLSLLNSVQAKLLLDLANGGYGIEPTDEAALWQRAREREQINGEARIRDAARQASARGLMMPPGVLNRQLADAANEALEKSSSVSRDIAMKRADLYVQNRQFTIEKAIETERALIEYLSAYFTRRLEAMKANLDAVRISVEIYTAQVQAFTAKLGAQEAQLRMQVESIDAQVKVNMAAVQKYVALLDVGVREAGLNIESFKATLQAESVRIDALAKADSVKIDGADARLRQIQQAIQNTVAVYKVKLDAMEHAAKLMIEPASNLAGMATAYIGATSSISATFA